MFDKVIVPLLLSILTYTLLPKSETNLLVLFELKTKPIKNEEINNLGNVRHMFEIIKNVDGHMKHVDTKGKESYNYAITSGNVKEVEIQTFKENLSKSTFVGKHQVFTFKTNPLRLMLINLLIKVKGF